MCTCSCCPFSFNKADTFALLALVIFCIVCWLVVHLSYVLSFLVSSLVGRASATHMPSAWYLCIEWCDNLVAKTSHRGERVENKFEAIPSDSVLSAVYLSVVWGVLILLGKKQVQSDVLLTSLHLYRPSPSTTIYHLDNSISLTTLPPTFYPVQSSVATTVIFFEWL